MNITNVKIWKLSLAGLFFLALLGFSAFSAWKYHKKYKSASQGLEQAENNMRIYAITVNELKETVYESKITMAENKRKLNLSQEQVERLKQTNIRKVHAIGELELHISSLKDSLIVYRDVDIEYEELDVEETVDGPMLPLPVSFSSKDEWLTQQARIGTDGLGSISFDLSPVKIDLTLGSRGLWNKSYVSAVSTNNPYASVTKNNFQLVDKRRKAWPYFVTTGIGIVFGMWVGGM